jgi:hypothetical protein
VVAAVKGGHAWIAESSGVELTFEATWGETTVSCGDHLGAGPGDVVDVRLVASGVPGAVAQVRGPAGVLAGGLADDTGQVTVEVQVPVASAAFVRAEVRRPDGVVVSPVDDMPAAQMVAMTNPIFLGPTSSG